MPRDSNGVYSLPAGNPVQTLTVISSTWANTTLSDLSTAMTGSLSRAGEGAMLAGLKLFDGTIGAPGLTWGTETTAGFYRAGAGDFRFAIGGADVFGIGTTGMGVGNGTAAVPSIFFITDPNTGIYRVGADNLGITAGGVLSLQVNTVGLYALDGAAATPSYSFLLDGNTGMYRVGADSIGFSLNGANTLTLAVGSSTFQTPIFIPNGTNAAPSLAFAGDTNTGIYFAGADILALAAGGIGVARITPTFAAFSLPVLVQDGTVGAPSFSFEGDTDTGLYRDAANSLSFGAGNGQRFRVRTSDIVSFVTHYFSDGVVGTPGITFTSDSDVGFYRIGADNIGLATGGVLRWNVGTGAIVNGLPMNIPDGSTAAPSIRFSSDTDTGINWGGSNTGQLSAGGVLSALWDDSVTGNDTRFWLYCVAIGTFRRVITGAPNSGGAGFRMLTVAN